MKLSWFVKGFFIQLLILISLASVSVTAQDTLLFRNPSFESNVVPANEPNSTASRCFGDAPPPWDELTQATPDLQPGCKGNGWTSLHSYLPASDGETYIALVSCYPTSTSREYIAQHVGDQNNDTAGIVMKAGKRYKFTIDLAYADGYSAGCEDPMWFEIYGGNFLGHEAQLLWESPVIGHEEWQTYTIEFTPDANYAFVKFAAPRIEAKGKRINGNILIDNITPMVTGVVETGNPKHGDALIYECFNDSIIGKTDTLAKQISITYKLGTKSITIYPDSTIWSAVADYSGFTGWDTIIVIATFPIGIDPDTNRIAVFWGEKTAYFDTSSNGLTMRFTDKTDSNFKKATFKWNFGDGGISTLQNPSHTYKESGYYEVTEYITYYEDCYDTLTDTIYVFVDEPVFTPVKGAYHDADGDGGINYASIMFNEDLDNLPKKIILQNPFHSTIIDTTTLVAWKNSDPSTRTLIATLSKPWIYDSSTYFAPSNLATILSEGYSTKAIIIHDSVAPVIKSALYIPGSIINTKTLNRGPDTLVILFSEVMQKVVAESPFKLLQFDDVGVEKRYALNLTRDNQSGTGAQFIVDAITGNTDVTYPKDGDSIWIDNKKNIADNSGTIQLVDQNRRVPLEVREKPVLAKLTGINVIDGSKMPQVKSIDSPFETGTFFVIDLYSDVSKYIDSISFTAVIFDPVGNVLSSANGIDVKEGELQTYFVTHKGLSSLLIYWSAKNKNGRMVGTGTYLAQFSIRFPKKIDNSGSENFNFYVIVN